MVFRFIVCMNAAALFAAIQPATASGDEDRSLRFYKKVLSEEEILSKGDLEDLCAKWIALLENPRTIIFKNIAREPKMYFESARLHAQNQRPKAVREILSAVGSRAFDSETRLRFTLDLLTRLNRKALLAAGDELLEDLDELSEKSTLSFFFSEEESLKNLIRKFIEGKDVKKDFKELEGKIGPLSMTRSSRAVATSVGRLTNPEDQFRISSNRYNTIGDPEARAAVLRDFLTIAKAKGYIKKTGPFMTAFKSEGRGQAGFNRIAEALLVEVEQAGMAKAYQWISHLYANPSARRARISELESEAKNQPLDKARAGELSLLKMIEDGQRRGGGKEDPQAALQVYNTLQAGLSIVTKIVGFKNPKLAAQVQKVGANVLQAGFAIFLISKGKEKALEILGTGATAGPATPYIMLAQAAVMLIEELIFNKSEADVETQRWNALFDMLVEIRKDIADLKKYVAKRFDRLERILEEGFSETLRVLKIVGRETLRNREHLLVVQAIVNKIQSDLSYLTARIALSETERQSVEVDRIIREICEHERVYGHAMTLDEHREAVKCLRHIVFELSRSKVANGVAKSRLPNAFAPAANIGFYAKKVGYPAASSLPNPEILAKGLVMLAELKGPKGSGSVRDRSYGVEEPVQALKKFIEYLQSRPAFYRRNVRAIKVACERLRGQLKGLGEIRFRSFNERTARAFRWRIAGLLETWDRVGANAETKPIVERDNNGYVTYFHVSRDGAAGHQLINRDIRRRRRLWDYSCADFSPIFPVKFVRYCGAAQSSSDSDLELLVLDLSRRNFCSDDSCKGVNCSRHRAVEPPSEQSRKSLPMPSLDLDTNAVQKELSIPREVFEAEFLGIGEVVLVYLLDFNPKIVQHGQTIFQPLRKIQLKAYWIWSDKASEVEALINEPVSARGLQPKLEIKVSRTLGLEEGDWVKLIGDNDTGSRKSSPRFRVAQVRRSKSDKPTEVEISLTCRPENLLAQNPQQGMEYDKLVRVHKRPVSLSTRAFATPGFGKYMWPTQDQKPNNEKKPSWEHNPSYFPSMLRLFWHGEKMNPCLYTTKGGAKETSFLDFKEVRRLGPHVVHSGNAPSASRLLKCPERIDREQRETTIAELLRKISIRARSARHKSKEGRQYLDEMTTVVTGQNAVANDLVSDMNDSLELLKGLVYFGLNSNALSNTELKTLLWGPGRIQTGEEMLRSLDLILQVSGDPRAYA